MESAGEGYESVSTFMLSTSSVAGDSTSPEFSSIFSSVLAPEVLFVPSPQADNIPAAKSITISFFIFKFCLSENFLPAHLLSNCVPSCRSCLKHVIIDFDFESVANPPHFYPICCDETQYFPYGIRTNLRDVCIATFIRKAKYYLMPVKILFQRILRNRSACLSTENHMKSGFPTI